VKRIISIYLTTAYLLYASTGMAVSVEDPNGSIANVPIQSDNITIFVPILKESVPEDPGERGLTTVAGVDVDNDGVRDDVENMIALRFPHSPAIRQSLYVYARGIQLMVTAQSAQGVITGGNEALRGTTCLSTSAGLLYEEASKIVREFTVEMLNTIERAEAYANNLPLRGITTPKIQVATCEL